MIRLLVKTMVACPDAQKSFHSPHTEQSPVLAAAAAAQTENHN